ncbi:hypothetical protein LWP59_26865 [Amycolatopsis acidiphila]|uniref:Uncharacterized protein n=1 Tax=Amycolatopsis acidiphila TaxID=715473 RepID=A0A558AIK3_9PSEU|nr:hypothetical protein [Amycolatopsis acidiphila]TVT24095.1 hypothetical protein FNH06_07800 [Amycolatopsis acidiphila]UIJ57749.1 hypothetical protein LWP59_26865 [Amycolatopsis acidiphila]GHG87460.1 hypothetical protein GCM10017788_61100 [Amycolatopsis acidiphila]
MAGVSLVAPGAALAVPQQCDRQGQIDRFYCAQVTAVPAGQTLPLLQSAAADAPAVAGTAYNNGDQLVLDCWATSPLQEALDGDAYWFSVFDIHDNSVEGYVSDHNLTTGRPSDWLDTVGECSGDNNPPVTTGVYQCDRQGGEYRAQCANVTTVSDDSYLHLLTQPDLTAAHIITKTYNDGAALAVYCWTEVAGARVDGDPYWFEVFDPQDNAIEGYVNDYYLSTGSVTDWQPKVQGCTSTPAPPPTVTKTGDGKDPHDAEESCPDTTPKRQPLNLRVRSVSVSTGNEITTTDQGVKQVGTVQNCLARQTTGPEQGIMFSSTHVRLYSGWGLTSRVLGLSTVLRGPRYGDVRVGQFTTVYPPGQAGCSPQPCRSETYFLTRAQGQPVSASINQPPVANDYDFESRPVTTPVCNGQYGMATARLSSDPGGDNLETQRVISLPDGPAVYKQAGWLPKPGTFDFEGVTFAWSSQKTFDQSMWAAEARDRVALRPENSGSRVEVPFEIDNGGTESERIVDVLTPDGTAIEVKTGGDNRALDKVEQQINNDVALLSSPASGVHKVVWLFLPGATDPTNQGPTAEVEQLLKAAGKKVPLTWQKDSVGQLCQVR